MKKEEFAQFLDGLQNGVEIGDYEKIQAEKNKLLVCFISDDLLKLKGLIFDEFVVDERDTKYHLYIGEGGDLTCISQIEIEEIKEILAGYNLGFILPKIPIKIQWCPKELDCTWLITTNIPHATFDVINGGELYCRGIVLELTDIENYLKN